MSSFFETTNNTYGLYSQNQNKSKLQKLYLLNQRNKNIFFQDDSNYGIQNYFGNPKYAEPKMPNPIQRGVNSSYKYPYLNPSLDTNQTRSHQDTNKQISYGYNPQYKKSTLTSEEDDCYSKNNNFSLVIESKIGFQNLGNTCFMNTCLQNLLHTESFIQSIFQIEDKISFSTPITKRFLDLCLSSISNSKYSSSISPIEFKKAFSQKHPEFRGYNQHDTQEFCRYLLEDMSQELNIVRKPSPYVQLQTDGKSKTECNREFDQIFRNRENSIIIDNFYGQLINIFTCTCKHQTFSFEKFLDIPLIIPFTATVSVSIKELMQNFFEDIKIQFEQKCIICHKKTNQKRELKISQPPENLILSIQRINGRVKKKNTIDVRFDEEINLKDFVDFDCFNGSNCKYTLYGIGNHSGTIDFGHYYAYIKIKDEWYEFNDSMVSKTTLSRTSNKVYVLFYKKKK